MSIGRFGPFVLLLVYALLAACSSLGNARPAEEIVGERALEHARALMAGDFDGAIEFMIPTYKNSPRAKDFKRSKSGATGWQDVSLKWVKCDDGEVTERCEVRLIVKTLRPPAVMVPITVPLDDVWILVEGGWYQYP